MTVRTSDSPVSRTLRDGTTIAMRTIEPDDAPALQRFHGRLSEHSIYLRFFGFVPELSDERARYFTQLDNLHRLAVVAFDPDDESEIIAVARLDREPGTDSGEYAAIVEDRWQGRGVGFAVTRHLLDLAVERGFRPVYAMVLPQNDRMLALLRDLGFPTRTRSVAGVARVDFDLSQSAEGSARQQEPVLAMLRQRSKAAENASNVP
jgi:RimJ/RimL family protein N-acetyltransferase